MSPRFYLFVSDVNQGNKGDGLKIFLRAHRDGDLPRAVKNIEGCESLWNS